MQGIVKAVNSDDGLVMVEVGGRYALVGLLEETPLEVGDELHGPLDQEGPATLTVASKQQSVDAYVEACGLDEAAARQRLE